MRKILVIAVILLLFGVYSAVSFVEEDFFTRSSFLLFGACEDDDDDGICNSNDICLDSHKGERVDKNGCDPFQFCERFYCGISCYYADFLDDENKTYPNDCILVIVHREGEIYPKCVPVECKKNVTITLPDGLVQVRVEHPGAESYFDTTLMGVPAGYYVGNGTYIGWCVDETNQINPGTLYNAKLYSSYDPNLGVKCPYCVDPDWDKVNYILNNKRGSPDDIQDAIWYFVDGGAYPTTPFAIQMVENANLYGDGFLPDIGQFLAVIVDPGNRTQLSIIEVDP